MVQVFRRRDEDIEKLIFRFTKAVEKDGIMTKWKEQEYYITPSLKRHRKAVDIKHRREKRRKNAI